VTETNTITPLAAVESGPGRAARTETPKRGPDKVSLSEEVQKKRQENIEHLKEVTQQVADGKYKVNLDLLAEAIMRKEQM